MKLKTLVPALLSLILIPAVYAQIGEGVISTLSLIFNTGSSDIAIIKAAMWVTAFFLIFKGTQRIFLTNRGSAVILALIISILGVRYLPDEYAQYLGMYFIVIILIFLPYFIGNLIADLFRVGRFVKVIFIMALYGVFGYGLYKFPEYTGGYGEHLGILAEAFSWMLSHRIIIWIAVVVICWLLFRSLKSPTYMPGRSLFGGIGRGAMGAGALAGKGIQQGAAIGAARARNWWEQRKTGKR